MVFLQWTFEWEHRGAYALSPLGRYTISGDDSQKWTAKFHKNGDGTAVITPVDAKHTLTFNNLAEAIRACQRHCDGHSSSRSGRMAFETPLPLPK